MQAEIENLIASEDDPSRRALLLILHSLTQSIEQMRNSVENHKKDFTEHQKDFMEHREEFRNNVMYQEKVLNQSRGAWKVLVWVLTLVQSVILFVLMQAHAEWSALRAADTQLQQTVIQLMEKVKSLETHK